LNPVRGVQAANAIQKLEDYRDKATKSGGPTWVVREAAKQRRPERFKMTPKIKEHTCPACGGTGYPVVNQPVQPGRRIYPVKCVSCDGKGKVTDAN